MQVNNYVHVPGINQTQNNNPYSGLKVNGVATMKTEADTVTISHAGKNAEDKWQAIANKYNVTNMSQTEVGAMTEKLYDNKLIPKDVLLHMMAPASMNQDFDKKDNVLDRMRDSLVFSKNSGGNTEQVEKQRRVVEIFERLNGLLSNDSQS
jgi:hypothetical protein